MITKKLAERGLNIFDSLRGPNANREKCSSIDPFIKFLLKSTDNLNIYSKFHNEVLTSHQYYTQEMLDATTKFINENITIID